MLHFFYKESVFLARPLDASNHTQKGEKQYFERYKKDVNEMVVCVIHPVLYSSYYLGFWMECTRVRACTTTLQEETKLLNNNNNNNIMNFNYYIHYFISVVLLFVIIYNYL